MSKCTRDSLPQWDGNWEPTNESCFCSLPPSLWGCICATIPKKIKWKPLTLAGFNESNLYLYLNKWALTDTSLNGQKALDTQHLALREKCTWVPAVVSALAPALLMELFLTALGIIPAAS